MVEQPPTTILATGGTAPYSYTFNGRPTTMSFADVSAGNRLIVPMQNLWTSNWNVDVFSHQYWP
jgi:hypothetical protein